MGRARPAKEFEDSRHRALREQAELPPDVSLAGVGAVLDRCGGDDDLAVTALMMSPRPAWVSELLGLHPERKAGS